MKPVLGIHNKQYMYYPCQTSDFYINVIDYFLLYINVQEFAL